MVVAVELTLTTLSSMGSLSSSVRCWLLGDCLKKAEAGKKTTSKRAGDCVQQLESLPTASLFSSGRGVASRCVAVSAAWADSSWVVSCSTGS